MSVCVSYWHEPHLGSHTCHCFGSRGDGMVDTTVTAWWFGARRARAAHWSVPTYLHPVGIAAGLAGWLLAVHPRLIGWWVAAPQVELSGPASEAVRPSGTIRLQNGDINLVATQLSLSRDHPNTITFAPDAGPLDPTIDVLLAGDEVRALIQGGASSWQDNVVITSARPGGGPTGETLEQLDPTRIARIFEDQLAEAILAEDGQIAFSNLAASAVSSVMPKMETHGQLGKARWGHRHATRPAVLPPTPSPLCPRPYR